MTSFDVQPGDIYSLGESHRLMCGDATKKEDVKRLFNGRKPTLVVTSPPYLKARAYDRPIACWSSMMTAAFSELDVDDSAQIFVNLGIVHKNNNIQFYWNDWVLQMNNAGWRTCGMYIWDKLSAPPGNDNCRPRPCHELIFLFNKANISINKTDNCISVGRAGGQYGLKGPDNKIRTLRKHPPTGQKKVTDSVFRMPPEKTKAGAGHPAVFPVGLPAKLISIYKKNDTLCYDPFIGSGTCFHAAQREDVSCFGMEIAPTYCQIALARWAKAYPEQPIIRVAVAS